MVDVLKLTIMEKLKERFEDIIITDTPINNEKSTKDYKLPSVLFKKYKDSEHKLIEVIDYNMYNKYMKETIPDFKNLDLCKFNLVDDKNKKHKILKWNSDVGVFEVSKPIYDLHSYNSLMYVSDENYDIIKNNKDFIFVYSAYNYANTLNKNTVEYFHRFNIDVFIYDDLDNNKIDFYSKEIHKLFNRDFTLLNAEGKKTKETVYIYNQLSFDMSEYNVSNKILRGSMLLKTYEK